MQISPKGLLFTLILVFAQGLYAANFVVDTVVDQLDANPGDGVCADAGGQCSLRAAIQEANALTGSHSIDLPVGSYILTGASGEDAAVTGDLDITADISIVGTDTRNTIVDGNSLDRIFHILPTASLQIELLSLANGNATDANGGAVYNDGSFSMDQVSISNSMTMGSLGSAGILTGGGLGGAIYNAGSLTITKSLINACSAEGGAGESGINPGGGGGGGGSAGMGGALFNEMNATANFINTTLSGNSAIGGRGGNGSWHANSGTVESNGGNGGGQGAMGGLTSGGGASGAAGFGGGGGGGASLLGAGNNGGFGGGAGAGGANSWGGPSGVSGMPGQFGGAAVQGCCSESGGGGGGAALGGAVFNNNGAVTFVSCTIAFNTCTAGNGGGNPFGNPASPGQALGGGVFNWSSGSFDIENSILAQNMATDGSLEMYGTIISNGYNLIMSSLGFTFSPANSDDILGVDPMLDPLSDLGGSTDVHAGSCTSAIVNGGSTNETLDQNCQPRPTGSGDDIGAHESQSSGLPGFIKN